jgi:hypothetical protein
MAWDSIGAGQPEPPTVDNTRQVNAYFLDRVATGIG